MKIIFVCTGNTCRSPMAAAIAKKIFIRKGIDAEVCSKGLFVSGETEASKNAFTVMEEKDLDIKEHKPSNISYGDVMSADIVLAMTESHKGILLNEFPEFKDRIFTLKEFATGNKGDIADPFGRDVNEYRACADDMEKYILLLANKLAENANKKENYVIALGCDHGGFILMQEVKKYLTDEKIKYIDFGTYSEESCDYPVYGKAAAEAVASGKCDKGIIICGTGIGISITANKVKGIRAALCGDCFSAKATRQHNDANMLALGARVVGPGLALEIVKTFLSTDFSGEERHKKRIGQIES